MSFFFFFSSRRRHTRCSRDWSSDVCSSDLDNLVDWTPLADSAGRLVKVLTPRRGYFDAWLVEAGPPAIITPHGILLMYNAGNSGQYGDPTLPDRIYTGGQALYDGRNPLRLIARSDQPFIRPTEDYERAISRDRKSTRL